MHEPERYEAVNVDRRGCIAHIPESIQYDRGVVLDHHDLRPHPLTGRPQPHVVFAGLMPACLAEVRRLNAKEDS